MKKTKTPRTGRPPKAGPLLVGKTIHLTPYQWGCLSETGNISRQVREILSGAGYPEQPITT